MKQKTFDAVAWMRGRREEMDEELRGLSSEERNAKLRTLLNGDPLFEPLRTRVVEQTEPPGAWRGQSDDGPRERGGGGAVAPVGPEVSLGEDTQ